MSCVGVPNGLSPVAIALLKNCCSALVGVKFTLTRKVACCPTSKRPFGASNWVSVIPLKALLIAKLAPGALTSSGRPTTSMAAAAAKVSLRSSTICTFNRGVSPKLLTKKVNGTLNCTGSLPSTMTTSPAALANPIWTNSGTTMGVGIDSSGSVGSPLPFGSGSKPSVLKSSVPPLTGLFAQAKAELLKGPGNEPGSNSTTKLMVACAPSAKRAPGPSRPISSTPL